MDEVQALALVVDALQKAAPDVSDVSEATVLLGSDGVLDSMTLVGLCLELEDQAEVFGFSFDWTSDSAMSRNRSMFRTVGSLASELVHQAKP